MRLRRLARRLVLVAVVATTVAVNPHSAGVRRSVSGSRSRSAAPRARGAAGRSVSQTQTAGPARRSRSRTWTSGDGTASGCKERGTAYVYVGDQWYDLNLGLYSMSEGKEVGCWAVQVKATSTSRRMHRLGFVRPDERAIEVEPGDYILTALAADNAVVDPAGNSQCASRSARASARCRRRTCRRVPGMTNKPDNPDLFQVGVTSSRTRRSSGRSR